MWPLVGFHAAVDGSAALYIWQLIGLSGLLETRKRAVGEGAGGGGDNDMSRRRCWGEKEGIPAYVSLLTCMKFSKKRKEKMCQTEQALGMEVFESTAPLKN